MGFWMHFKSLHFHFISLPHLPVDSDTGSSLSVRLLNMLPVSSGMLRKVLASISALAPHSMQTERIVSCSCLFALLSHHSHILKMACYFDVVGRGEQGEKGRGGETPVRRLTMCLQFPNFIIFQEAGSVIQWRLLFLWFLWLLLILRIFDWFTFVLSCVKVKQRSVF